MRARVRRPRRLRGRLRVPGDKSISHRALILNAIADGEARLTGLSAGEDVGSTTACLRALGVHLQDDTVQGVGLHGLKPAPAALDCGNSGTTMRLLAGVLAGQPFESVLVGDASLSRRPMDRVLEPLRRMGAAASWPPLRVGGRTPLRGITYQLPVASAQVKSAVLLAGLYAEGETAVVEPAPTRDHTERLLAAMRTPDGRLRALDLELPGDPSAAAFWVVLGALHPDADLELPGVGVNASRTAYLSLAPAGRGDERWAGPEPVADLRTLPLADRRAWRWDPALSAQVIDELPVLAVAATQLEGTTRITGARELRVKESDRIAAMSAGLAAMGAALKELDDGWEIRGPRPLQGARVDSRGDHRVAMALAVAGLLAEGKTEVEGAECVSISYPGFWEEVERICR
ncbi:MAG TPA: 3-phosphoshikimate 1-carboxyvinyltransferase [Candidatus Acidoferrales bacterium]|nr:3-phosphoshikimate 1-carboxyvinyltransferase [Candidatus Acidoferrales bacterium]